MLPTPQICHQLLIAFQCQMPLPQVVDDMVLELAVKAGCESIITYNTRDFAGVEQFGLKLLEPSGFLGSIGKLP